MIDLPQEYQDYLRQLAAAHLPTAEVLAYGSRVKGGAHALSDLDLAVRQAGGVDAQQLLAFRRAIEESNLPMLVQVLDWNAAPEAFRQEILHCYEVLYP